jgi:hypothetical protein
MSEETGVCSSYAYLNSDGSLADTNGLTPEEVQFSTFTPEYAPGVIPAMGLVVMISQIRQIETWPSIMPTLAN